MPIHNLFGAGLDNRVYDSFDMSASDNPIGASEAVFIPEMMQPRKGERAEHIKLLHDRFPAMSSTVIANKVGCDESNVRRVLSKYVRDCSIDELRDFQGNEADILDAIREKTLASITDEDLAKASLLQKVTASAILMDKSRLLQGQPTSIHVHALMDVAAMIREKRDRCELTRQQVDVDDAEDTTGE